MIRWSYSNMRSFCPTARVAASGAGISFPRTLKPDLGGVRFTPLGSDATITFEQSLTDVFTDGILVLHKGAVVFERWFGVTGPETRHIAFSVTKSFVGTLIEMLVGEGRVDLSARVDSVIPELAPSGFGSATIGQVHAMTTALDFAEDYADPNSGIGAYSAALGLTPRPASYTGPHNLWDYLKTVKAAGQHGQGFVYRTPNTDVLAWIITRIEGKPLHEVLSQRLWQPLGMLGDADLMVDEAGTPFAGGGLNLRLEDLARFGEALRLGGAGVIPSADVARIRSGGNRRISFLRVTRICLAGAMAASGGTPMMTTARLRRAASMGRLCGSIRQPKWLSRDSPHTRLRPVLRMILCRFPRGAHWQKR